MKAATLPLAEFADRRLGPLERFDFAPALGFAHLNDSEYLLSAHHMPLAVRLEDGAPRLGVLTHPDFLTRPQVDADGHWRASYLPISLRLWPFVPARRTGRPIDEIDVLAGPSRVGAKGTPICLDPEAGTLSPELVAIRNTLAMLRDGGDRLTRALDLLRIAGVFARLREEGGNSGEFLTVDPDRFAALPPETVATLARHSFLPLDLAAALMFSRRHLPPERLPVPEPVALGAVAGEAHGGGRADPMDFMFANLATLDFALDGSDLFDDGGGRVDWQELAPPPPPPAVEGLAL